MVVERGDRLGWHAGPTLLELLEAIEPAASVRPLPLRFPVQVVQRTTERGRTYLGRIVSGCVRAGQRIVVLPAGVTTTVKTIYPSSASHDSADAGDSIALALTDEIDVARGDLIAEAERAPKLARSFNATLVWLTNAPLQTARQYLLKHTTRTIKAKIALVSYLVDVNTLEQRIPSQPIGVNSIVHAALTAQQPLVIDAYAENQTTGAFILIDEASNQTVAAGLIG